MSDSKIIPRNHGRSKTKTSENLQIQYKKPSNANERLVVNKLGMKFDPVCWKKNHEKGRISFVCIESNCNADRRLGCAHCIIEEHDQHISNKVTVEQYCDSFENNFKCYLFQVAKLEEYYNKCKMIDLIDLIDKDINTILDIVKQQLTLLRDFYVKDIQTHAEQNNSLLISFYNTEKYTLSKIKEYAHKNLFEMTPAEMDHSMLLMDPTHLDKLINKLSQFDDQTLSLQNNMKSQWKVIYQQLQESIIDIISQIGQNNLEFIQPTIQDSPQELNSNLLKNQQQQLNTNKQSKLDFQRHSLQNAQNSVKQINQQQQYNSQQAYLYQQLPPQPSQNSQHSQSIKKEVNKHSINTVIQQYSSKQISRDQAQSNNQQLSNNQLQSNSPKASSENQGQKQFQKIPQSQQQMISPLKSGLNTASFGNLGNGNQKSLKNISQTNNNSLDAQSYKELQNNTKGNTNIRQTSPNGVNYYYQSDGKQLENRKNANHVQSLNSSAQKQQQSFDRRLSAQKIQNTQFTCNYNNMKCIHNDLIKASPIFSCCNWAFPCYECHDMISTHKAHITVPSQRFCQNCHETFSVNLMSTVDVKCYKCQ